MKVKLPIIRRLTTLFALLLFVFPFRAQEKTDSVFSFRFVTGKNEFYVPWNNNGNELGSLLDCVGKYRELILHHEVIVNVNGYCNSESTKAQNLALAKIRSNRVKSELITRQGLTEDCFKTRNHSGGGNYVLVNFSVPRDKVVGDEPQHKSIAPDNGNNSDVPATEASDENKISGNTGIDGEADNQVTYDDAVQDEKRTETADYFQTATPADSLLTDSDALLSNSDASATDIERRPRNVVLKTNLLFYAILMPNIEVEWMFAERWSAALEFQGAWYAKREPHKVYRVSTLMPEVRYWVINRSKWHGMYVGVFGGGGLYDLCDGKKGHEGEGGMAGVSAGYMWPISRYFSLEAGLGVGYLRIRDKVYRPFEGHYLYQLTKNINYVGPLRLKLSLVWRF